jgi:uncharacterized protein YndB with AHSA1/START domain
MAEINHLIGIKGSLSDVYAAISTIEGLKTWWTADTSGASEVGQTVRIRNGTPNGPDMKVTDLKKNQLVKWTCVGDPGEWVGTEFTFALKEENGQVNLRFTQAKWKNVTDSLAFCSTKWATYLMGLKELIETGTGRPYPHDLRTSHR